VRDHAGLKTSIVVVSIALAAAILLSVSLLVAKDARRQGALESAAFKSASIRHDASLRRTPHDRAGRI
jgi:hypothetical protein